jgi:hypothetical protein
MHLMAMGTLPVKEQGYYVRGIGITCHGQFLSAEFGQGLTGESALGQRERGGAELDNRQRYGNEKAEYDVQYAVPRPLFYAPDDCQYRYYYAQDVGCHAVGAEGLDHMALQPDEPCGAAGYGA